MNGRFFIFKRIESRFGEKFPKSALFYCEKLSQSFRRFLVRYAELIGSHHSRLVRHFFVSPIHYKGKRDDADEENYIQCSSCACGCEDEINAAIEKYAEPDEKHRGLMVYYDTNSPVNEKVVSAFPSVWVRNGELVGVLTCRLTSVSTAYGTTSYEYDKLDRLVRVVDRNGYATVYKYDANGNRSAVKYANGIVVSYDYDEVNRLILEKALDKQGGLVAQYEYTLGAAGELTAVKELDRTVEYTYDALYRLTSEKITAADGFIFRKL